ncbi:phytanoyl-CoA dioxygenase family protein [uncultured Shewanella sp.]|uniref:phytanoyl-CoA dioxygenase family protein n=1 Tax=uncultured Shewanella sp. TaxID=173975 RepID=UPI00262E567F|nr:phytanoyl-CoA dioxygenase family protein [uncultured Shewanella sp.]
MEKLSISSNLKNKDRILKSKWELDINSEKSSLKSKWELNDYEDVFISGSEWKHYLTEGYVVLNKTVDEKTINEINNELYEIMMYGKNSESLIMQLDSKTGNYNGAGKQSIGWKGPTLEYRKIENLENNNKFKNFFKSRLFNEVRTKAGITSPFETMRSMMMNKSPHGGTALPAHQDRWNEPNYKPTLSIYIAIDPAPIDSGCMVMYPKSHNNGLINKECHRGILNEKQLKYIRSEYSSKSIPLKKGNIVIFNSLCVHESNLNNTSNSRKSISCLM